MRAPLALGIAAAITIAARRAGADDLDDARKLAAELDYDRALVLVEHVLARGGNDPARVVELHVLAGELAAGLDRADAAEQQFAIALALRPELELPRDLSPKLTAPFAAARARQLRPLRVHADVVPGLARVAIDDDALGVVSGIAVDVVDAAGVHAELGARDATRVAIPPGAIVVELSALDATGNRVWIGPVERVAQPVAIADHPAWWSSWPTWAIVGGAAAAGAAAFAWREQVAQSEWNQLRADGTHDYSQLAAVQSRGTSYAIAADIGFGVALGAGVAAVALAVHRHRDRPSLVVTLRGGIGLGVAGAF